MQEFCLEFAASKLQATRIREVKEQMAAAESYSVWAEKAALLDELEGLNAWKARAESYNYDYRLIDSRLRQLQELQQQRDYMAIVFALRSGLLRNLGGIADQRLYRRTHIGTKQLVHQYTDKVCELLRFITDTEVPGFDLRHKYDFIYETRQSFGRTALLLSGGAGLGMYHFGIIKALWEQNLLPRVISGASVGSLVAGIVATHTDDELPRVWQRGTLRLDAFENTQKGSLMRKLKRLLRTGVLFDITRLQTVFREVIGDVTFKEAYDRTNRILNITVTQHNTFGDSTRILNFLTTPNVVRHRPDPSSV